MIKSCDSADILARKIRAQCDRVDPKLATHAAWRVAVVVAIKAYGVPLTIDALRDLADEIERDLINRGPLQ
ncbi:hypothetical protein LY56_01821 [Roseinatronobacter thiooxidans]|uniref:Uncharacterized protein n=2 Tax=Roseinatronobacter thiooxidans TaxID=121821 RepID=A0A2W7Q905_9RHOB|nr:hypothetical protein LY56_01821 [Roseinatronobacter thiooxidans]